MNRDDYIDGKVDHQTFYCAVADAIGRNFVERLVLEIASIETIRTALETDPHLNNIPLPRWDGMNGRIREAVSLDAQTVMAISWSDRGRHNLKPGTYCWSLSETICVLKAAARRMCEEQAVKP